MKETFTDEELENISNTIIEDIEKCFKRGYWLCIDFKRLGYSLENEEKNCPFSCTEESTGTISRPCYFGIYSLKQLTKSLTKAKNEKFFFNSITDICCRISNGCRECGLSPICSTESVYETEEKKKINEENRKRFSDIFYDKIVNKVMPKKG